MAWLPASEKNLKMCLFISTESMNMNMMNWQTHRQVPHDGIGGTCIAAHSKNSYSGCHDIVTVDIMWAMAVGSCL